MYRTTMALQPLGCFVLSMVIYCTGYKIDNNRNIRAKNDEQVGTPDQLSTLSSLTLLHSNDSFVIELENRTDKIGRSNASGTEFNDDSVEFNRVNSVVRPEIVLPNHSTGETPETTSGKEILQNIFELAPKHDIKAVTGRNGSLSTIQSNRSSQNNSAHYSLPLELIQTGNKTASVTNAAANNRKHSNGSSHVHRNGAHHKHGAHARHEKNTIGWSNSKHQLVFGHHLQLVPMEDEPFGAVIIKDQRFLVSVLIPVGIGMFGAALIITTLYVMRYMAQKQARQLADSASSRGPPIQSISSEVDDKVMLLAKDEDDEF